MTTNKQIYQEPVRQIWHVVLTIFLTKLLVLLAESLGVTSVSEFSECTSIAREPFLKIEVQRKKAPDISPEDSL